MIHIVIVIENSEQVLDLIVTLDDLSFDHSAIKVIFFKLVDFDALLY